MIRAYVRVKREVEMRRGDKSTCPLCLKNELLITHIGSALVFNTGTRKNVPKNEIHFDCLSCGLACYGYQPVEGK